MDKAHIANWFQGLQLAICNSLEEVDQKAKFHADSWERNGGGGGLSRVIRHGNVFEKGGVNFSQVHGTTPEAILKALGISGNPNFMATGVSIVIHPFSPKVPIIHMNVRYFEMSNGIWWFGGGIDLTPIYVVDSDARFFHQTLKDTCDKHDVGYYPKFKKWADEYFFIKHRNETRGVGGIFFDHMGRNKEISKEAAFSFVQAVGQTFVPVYSEIVNRNKSLDFSPEEKEWQLMRRGRYAEFNLVIDRGTKFGLDTDGRTESILMSLPPLAAWEYDFHPVIGSEEELTTQKLKKGIDWV
ncbi:MAG: oxygen-dependent coproporphyrinogen oxidase [Cytophagales bacterium]|nr:oxygen-dependent coproporphyrinogen oxidase [Cytophagales bacterium]